MLKIDRDKQIFSLLDTPTLADVSITERYDLQEFISNSPNEFFTEIGQELFLLGKEVEASKNVQDRIDLLAVDKEGTCVVIELKRGNHKLHMLQAISYAGMISQWEPDDCLQLLNDERQEELSNFLEVEREDINRQQRVLLVAESYDYALLVAAEWLSERYGVDIICCRIALAKDSASDSEYLVCSNVFPAPELAKEAVSRGRGRGGASKVGWPDWEAALSGITNNAVISYFRQELAKGREAYRPKRLLHYRLAGKRRWFVSAREKNAYVWQQGRFENDVEFWKHGLSESDDVKPVKNGACLRLFLNTAEHFQFFHEAATQKLQPTEWLDGLSGGDLEEVEQE
ncbi:MAG TPA: hypothetical protein VLK65_21420 [Vicinamibacteria bacterium]|nr:hypothetical protein [Vicinamibacteria bacterium]